MPRLRLTVMLLCLIGLTFSFAFAQDAGKRLVIMMKDGTTISGELIEVTPAVVKIKPNPKADPIEISWQKIRKLGNGTTRESIVKEWQKSHVAELCVTCQGTATTKCTTCEGKGVKPSEATPCTQCAGSGNLGPCKTPKCVDGMIPCPGKCLKADSFTGTPDAEGKRWRKFRGKGGNELKISDAHVGEVVEMENGEPTMKGPCPICNGTTRVPDPACGGTSLKRCNLCRGAGVIGPKCDTCKGTGQMECPDCKGTGLKPVSAPTEGQTPPEGQTPTDGQPPAAN